MIPTNVISRIFQIKFGTETGTCFTIDVDGKQYFVTAQHVVRNLTDNHTIQLFYKNNWHTLKVKLTGHSTISDVTVFSTDVNFGNLQLTPTLGGISYGQDLYFLGFPYGLRSEIGELNREFPLPLVKKGILSAVFFDSPGHILLIDGHNNPGFSGAPVIFQTDERGEFYVGGIISGYRHAFEDTFKNNEPTEIQVKTNTGIIIAYSIHNALKLIQANPNGKIIEIEN